MDQVLLTVSATSDGTRSCSFLARFPYVQGLGGATVYAQVAALDAGQPGLPLSLSEGRRNTIPAPPRPRPFTGIGASGVAAVRGDLTHDMIVAVELR